MGNVQVIAGRCLRRLETMEEKILRWQAILLDPTESDETKYLVAVHLRKHYGVKVGCNEKIF